LSALDAIIVGAGISGLATAFHLQRGGLDVVVLEAKRRPGGVIETRSRDGFLYETGPNSALDTTPLIDELLGETGLLDQRCDASAVSATRFVARNGKPVALPMSPPAFLGTPLFSLRTKLSLLREPFVRRSHEDADETIAQFVRRRLGREFLDYAIDPFVAGVYAGDPDSISVRAAFPRLHALEQKYGSLIRGQIRGARERRKSGETGKNAARSFSFRDGMQTLTHALARHLPHLETCVRVECIARSQHGDWQVDAQGAGGIVTRVARNVVLAVPAYAAAPLLAPFATAAARALEAIPYAPVAVAASAYRREDVGHALNGFGVLVPKVEHRSILGTLFSSSMFEHRAPAGRVLLTTFLGGMRQPDLPHRTDSEIAAIVADELAALLQARAPLWTEVVRWQRAIPQYNQGHLERIEQIEAARDTSPGLHFCANWLRGVAVGDCIKNARATADAILAEVL